MDLNAVIQAMIAVVKADATKEILPLLATFFTEISKNPTAMNIVAQLTSLNAQIVAKLPDIGQDALKAIADTLNAQVQALVQADAPKA